MIQSAQQSSAIQPVDLDSIAGIWRANELAIARGTTHPTGHEALDKELPGGGWPRSALTELLVQQHGIGEMQLVKPILAALSQKQRVALIQLPFLPHSMACRGWGINIDHIMWIKPKSSADALWAAEQILKSGSFGAVVLWQTQVRAESLRRLNLAAQGAKTWLWMVRPLPAAQDPSPSILRISLRPAIAGVTLNIVKRKGPVCDHQVYVHLPDMPSVRVDEGLGIAPRKSPAEVARMIASVSMV